MVSCGLLFTPMQAGTSNENLEESLLMHWQHPLVVATLPRCGESWLHAATLPLLCWPTAADSTPNTPPFHPTLTSSVVSWQQHVSRLRQRPTGCSSHPPMIPCFP
jgi:hypothetical protein